MGKSQSKLDHEAWKEAMRQHHRWVRPYGNPRCNFVELPTDIHREVIQWLLPWDIYKLSRASSQMRDYLIADKPVQLLGLRLYLQEPLMIRAEFTPLVDMGERQTTHPLQYVWTFHPLQTPKERRNKKKERKEAERLNRSANDFNCLYSTTDTHHEQPEEAFLHTLKNFVDIFRMPPENEKRITVHMEHYHLLERVLSLSPEFRRPGNLQFVADDFSPETKRMIASKLADFCVYKLGFTSKNGELNFVSINADFKCTIPPHLLETLDSDEHFKSVLQILKTYQDIVICSFWTRVSRELDREKLLEGLDVVPFDGLRGEVPLEVQDASHSTDTVALDRGNGTHLLITISKSVFSVLTLFKPLLFIDGGFYSTWKPETPILHRKKQ